MNRKKSLIQEWAVVFNSKKDWKQVMELASTSLIQTRPKTQDILSFFAQVGKLDINKLGEKSLLEEYSKMKLSDSDWKKLATEIPKVCSSLVKLRLDEDNPIPSNLELQYYFLENQMYKHLHIQKNKNEKKIKTTPDYNYYNKLYLSRFNELILSDVNQQNIRQRLSNLNKWESSLIQFHYISRLRIIVETANRSKYSNNFDLTKEQKKWIKKIPNEMLGVPIFKMYYLIYQMIYHESPLIYNQMLHELNTAEVGVFGPNNIQDFILYLNSFCVQQSYRGHEDSYANYVALVKLLIEKNLILNSGLLSPIRLKNAVKSGLESKQIEWTNHFFNNYKDLTLKTSSENIVQFCEAMIHFYQYEYEASNNILSVLPFLKDDLIKIDAFSLYIVNLLILGRYANAERISTNLREMLYRKEVVSDAKIFEVKKILYYSRLIIKKGNLKKVSSYKEIIDELNKEKNFKAKTWIERYFETKQ